MISSPTGFGRCERAGSWSSLSVSSSALSSICPSWRLSRRVLSSCRSDIGTMIPLSGYFLSMASTISAVSLPAVFLIPDSVSSSLGLPGFLPRLLPFCAGRGGVGSSVALSAALSMLSSSTSSSPSTACIESTFSPSSCSSWSFRASSFSIAATPTGNSPVLTSFISFLGPFCSFLTASFIPLGNPCSVGGSRS